MIVEDREFFTVRLDGSIKTGRQLFAAFDTIDLELEAYKIRTWRDFFNELNLAIGGNYVSVIVVIADDFRLPPSAADKFRWLMANIDEDGLGDIIFTTLHN